MEKASSPSSIFFRSFCFFFLFVICISAYITLKLWIYVAKKFYAEVLQAMSNDSVMFNIRVITLQYLLDWLYIEQLSPVYTYVYIWKIKF